MQARLDNHYIAGSTANVLPSRRGGLKNLLLQGTLTAKEINSQCFDITQRRTEESPVAGHINGEGDTLAHMTVMVIDQLYRHDSCLRQIRESSWIRTLGTSHPFGMKLRVDSL